MKKFIYASSGIAAVIALLITLYIGTPYQAKVYQFELVADGATIGTCSFKRPSAHLDNLGGMHSAPIAHFTPIDTEVIINDPNFSSISNIFGHNPDPHGAVYGWFSEKHVTTNFYAREINRGFSLSFDVHNQTGKWTIHEPPKATPINQGTCVPTNTQAHKH